MTTQKKSLRFRLADWLELKALSVENKKQEMQIGRMDMKAFRKAMKDVPTEEKSVDVDEVTNEAMIKEPEKE
jgi:hypothetical protein